MRRINELNYEVWEVSKELDSHGQRLGFKDSGRRIRANISTSTQYLFEDKAHYVVTYLSGLTWDRQLKVGQELRHGDSRYLITSVNNDARQAQLTLEKR